MNVGIIGAGNIGSTVGRLWTRAGHRVCYATRDASKLAPLLDESNGLARAGTVAEAAAFGPVLLFAAPYSFWPEFAAANATVLSGVTVIDAANPYPQRDGAVADAALALGAGAYTQSLVPRAHVVKSFNTIFWRDLRDQAHRAPPRLAIALAGDDARALDLTRALIDDAGFDPVDAGDLARSRRLDPGAPVYAKSLSAIDLVAALRNDGFAPAGE